MELVYSIKKLHLHNVFCFLKPLSFKLVFIS